MTTVQTVGAVSGAAAEWLAIDWQSVNRNVRRLQVRIVQAWKAMKPTSQTVKGPICEIHFGVRPLFAFSPMSYPHRHRSPLQLIFPPFRGTIRVYPVPLK